MNNINEEIQNTVIQPFLTQRAIDLSGIPICNICDHLLEGNQAQCELLCHHKFHTICIMTYVFRNGPVRCIECGEDFYRYQDAANIATEIAEKTQRIIEKIQREKLNRFEEEVFADNELLLDLKNVKKYIKEARKSALVFQKLQGINLREFKQEANNLKELIQSMKDRRLKILKDSSESKLYNSKRARANFYIRVFERKYPTKKLIDLHAIRRLKIPSRWELNRILRGRYRRFYWRMKVRI